MRIGTLETGGLAVLAPMAGVTDLAFRTICARMGAAVTVTEMVSSRALVYQDKKSIGLLKKTPVGLCGAQIFGNDPEIMAQGAKLALAHSGCDFLDLNMGCPMPKIVNNGDGSALMKDPALAGRIVRAVVDAVDVPVTVKTRLGWDDNSKIIVELAERLQDVGIAALTIHGRTRCQLYKGEADWTLIGAVKNNPRMHIPIIGNGDITTPAQAALAFERYGVDGIMIGRATYGPPWIFREIRHYLDSGSEMEPLSIGEKVALAKRHLELSLKFKGEPRGIYEMRRHLSCYFKGLDDFKQTRMRMVTTLDKEELINILDEINEKYA